MTTPPQHITVQLNQRRIQLYQHVQGTLLSVWEDSSKGGLDVVPGSAELSDNRDGEMGWDGMIDDR